ncbi:MAG: hypothetical protein HRT41_08810 [Campylobacteraceae bacterium]|nr:hypothetical protein [Campylobacteraceae bacterium]
MKLLLLSKTPIIIQIFKLICVKLELEYKNDISKKIQEKYDLIVLDEEYIVKDFSHIKQYARRIGIISKDKLSTDTASDFEITRPFLPKQLNDILEEQIVFLKNEVLEEIKQEEENMKDESLVNIDELNSYVDSIADYIVDDIDNDNDESIVSFSSLNEGGVLDSSELSKINQILLDSSVEDAYELDQREWKDLSDVIDEALNEVKEYEFSDSNKSIDLILNQYNLDELSPLFSKVDQSIIDRLTRGESIDIRLSLKA